MNRVIVRLVATCLVLLTFAVTDLSQQKQRRKKQRNLICRAEVFAALQPLPELDYECPDTPNEYDERILQDPGRLSAIKEVIGELQSFTSPRWWQADIDDLNVCYLHGKPGLLSPEERADFTGPEYQVRVLGTHQVRLLVTPDPCYQTSYNGANAYLLYRQGTNVHVTQALNGYYSRLAKSILLHLSGPPAAPLIEIETVNIMAMRPDSTPYYFVIDKAAGKIVEKKFGNRIRKPVRGKP